MENQALELLKAEVAKIDEEFKERQKKIDRTNLFFKYAFGILIASIILEPFIILFIRGLCN